MKRNLTAILLLLATSLLFAAKVHIIGDSMSSIYGDQSNQASANKDYTDGMRGWGQFFEEYLNGMEVQDWAHTGTTAKGFYSSANYWKAVMGITDYNSTGYQTYLLERPYVTGYTAVAAGDYVIITFGHNDQKGGPASVHNGYKTVTESEYLTYLTKMVNEVKAKGAYPILGTSICRSLWSGSTLTALGKIDAGEAAGDPGNEELNYPLQARQLAATLNIPCLDMNLGSRTIWEECGKSITGAVFFPAGGTTHTSEAGARAICAWANNTIASWTQANMNGATLSDYQPLISAMKSGITIPQKSDFASQEAVVTEKTLWTFDQDLEGNAYQNNSVVTSTLLNYNGLYLRGFTSGSTTRSFTTVSNTESVTFSDEKAITVTPKFQITTSNVLGAGKGTETSICPGTAGVTVSDGTSRCVAINTAGPGTFYIAMRSSSSASSGRVFNLAFNGEIKATAPTSTTITELKWHATTGGVFCAWATQAYNIAAVKYVPDADDSEDRLHEGGETPEPPVATRVPVIITAGQSNTDGRGTLATQPDYLRAAVGESGMAHVLWSYGNSTGWGYTGGAGQFAAFKPAAESSTGTTAGRWAYDAIAYYYIAQTLSSGINLHIIKESAGGSSIAPASTSSGDRHWSVDAEWLSTHGYVGDGNGGTALSPALRYNIQQCVNTLVDDSKIPDFRAIFWHQGESDRSPSASANAYYDNLKALIAYFRQSVTLAMNTKYGVDTYDFSTLPFIMGTVSKQSSLYNVTIEQAMKRIAAEDANVYLIDMQDGTMLSDAKHFDAASAELFGKRIYNKVCDLGLLSEYGVEVQDRLNDVVDAQLVVDFGQEHIVAAATTWTFDNLDGSLTELTDWNGLYLRGNSTSNHDITSVAKSATIVLGNEEIDVTKVAQSNSNSFTPQDIHTAGMTVNNSTDRTFAVNVADAGTFYIAVAPTQVAQNTGRTLKLWFNGTTVASKTLAEIAAEGTTNNMIVLRYTCSGRGVFYFTSEQGYQVFAAKWVPDNAPEDVRITMDSKGYATFGNIYSANFSMPSGLKAYIIDVDAEKVNNVTMTEVERINNGQAYILQGTPNETYTLLYSAGAGHANNLLVPMRTNGVVHPSSGEDFLNYILNTDGLTPVFTKITTPTAVQAGQAFLSISTGDAHSEKSVLKTADSPDALVVFDADATYTDVSTSAPYLYRLTKDGYTISNTKNNSGYRKASIVLHDGSAAYRYAGGTHTLTVPDNVKVTSIHIIGNRTADTNSYSTITIDGQVGTYYALDQESTEMDYTISNPAFGKSVEMVFSLQTNAIITLYGEEEEVSPCRNCFTITIR